MFETNINQTKMEAKKAKKLQKERKMPKNSLLSKEWRWLLLTSLFELMQALKNPRTAALIGVELYDINISEIDRHPNLTPFVTTSPKTKALVSVDFGNPTESRLVFPRDFLGEDGNWRVRSPAYLSEDHLVAIYYDYDAKNCFGIYFFLKKLTRTKSI